MIGTNSISTNIMGNTIFKRVVIIYLGLIIGAVSTNFRVGKSKSVIGIGSVPACRANGSFAKFISARFTQKSLRQAANRSSVDLNVEKAIRESFITCPATGKSASCIIMITIITTHYSLMHICRQ